MRLWSSAGRLTAAGEAESFDFSSGRMGENTEVLCSYLCSAYYIYMLLTSVRHVSSGENKQCKSADDQLKAALCV